MVSALVAPLGLVDYLAAENRSPLRHEFVDGCVYAMTGGTLRHNRIALNIAAALMQRLAGSPCQVFINDVKLHVRSFNSIYYPDVLVLYGRTLADGDKLVTDATLIVEVSSESTADIDRREKRLAYQTLPGLRAYWMVSQEERSVQSLTRATDGRWDLTVHTEAGDELPAPGVAGAPLKLADLYAGTDLAV